MRYLTAEEVLILHARIIDEIGGVHGIREVDLLLSATLKPQGKIAGKDLYPGVFKKTAILFEALANYHVFIDGNKRTALVSAARFLYVNGYAFDARNAEAEQIALSVATKEINVDQLESELKALSKKITRR